MHGCRVELGVVIEFLGMLSAAVKFCFDFSQQQQQVSGVRWGEVRLDVAGGGWW